MIRKAEIKSFVKRLVQEFSPERVILFGSCARGVPGRNSDVDLLVVMNCRKNPIDQAVEIRWRIPRAFPLDLLVRRPAEIRRRLTRGDSFIGSVMREGRVLYERKRRLFP